LTEFLDLGTFQGMCPETQMLFQPYFLEVSANECQNYLHVELTVYARYGSNHIANFINKAQFRTMFGESKLPDTQSVGAQESLVS